MYMAPVVAKPEPASPALRIAVGVPVLLASVVVMVPWLAVNAAISTVVIGGLAVARGPRNLVRMIDYAGKVALGR